MTKEKVAVVGVGYWGRNIARSFASLGNLGAIVDNNPVQAEEVSKALGIPKRSLHDVLMDPKIAGVAIATRAETHFAIAKAAIDAGKHVFVEKPLVLDLKEAETLISQAKATGRTLMVGHLLRYHPLFRKMGEIVLSGKYGRMRHIYSDRMSLGKIRTEEDVLWSFAPHDISMVLALAGEEPQEVFASGSAFINTGIADFASLNMQFANGLVADIRTTWISHRKLQQCVAICDHASIVFEDSEKQWDKKLSIHSHQVTIENGLPVPKRQEVEYVTAPESEPLKEECQHFLDCLAGAKPLTDGTEGRAVLRILQLASDSMKRHNA
jgi:predicted dehydrogenase